MTAESEGFGRTDPLKSDDPADWQRLIDAVNPAAMLLRIQSRMGPALRQHMTAEDIWQETLMCAWRDRKQCEWRGLREFRAWLVQVAENRIREAVERLNADKRSLSRELPFSSLSPARPQSTDGSAFDPPGETRTPSSLLAHTERAAAMQEALERLPEIYRKVLWLRIFEEWDREKIAAELELSLAAVKHRIRLGAAMYRERLGTVLSTHRSRPPKNV